MSMLALRVVTARVLVVLSGSFTSQIQTYGCVYGYIDWTCWIFACVCLKRFDYNVAKCFPENLRWCSIKQVCHHRAKCSTSRTVPCIGVCAVQKYYLYCYDFISQIVHCIEVQQTFLLAQFLLYNNNKHK